MDTKEEWQVWFTSFWQENRSTDKCKWRTISRITQTSDKEIIRKVYHGFIDNTWAADIAELRSLSSFNLSVKNLLVVIDVFTKCACVEPLKDRKTKATPSGVNWK